MDKEIDTNRTNLIEGAAISTEVGTVRAAYLNKKVHILHDNVEFAVGLPFVHDLRPVQAHCLQLQRNLQHRIHHRNDGINCCYALHWATYAHCAVQVRWHNLQEETVSNRTDICVLCIRNVRANRVWSINCLVWPLLFTNYWNHYDTYSQVIVDARLLQKSVAYEMCADARFLHHPLYWILPQQGTKTKARVCCSWSDDGSVSDRAHQNY